MAGAAIQYYFFGVALVMDSLAAWLILRRVAVLRSGGTTEGMVTAHVRREIDDSVSYHPTVVFVDDDGATRYFTSNAGWRTPRPAVGAKVNVVYSRTNPEVAYIASFLHLWAAPLALAVMSTAAVVAGIILNN